MQLSEEIQFSLFGDFKYHANSVVSQRFSEERELKLR